MICKYKNCNNKTEPIKNWGTKYKLYCSRDCRYLEYNRDNRYSAGNRLQKNKKYLSRYPTLVKEFNYELPSTHNSFIYLIEGEIKIGEKTHDKVENSTLILLSKGQQLKVTSLTKAKFLLISGKPIGEQIARGGPFVMNTKQEILQAIDDYHNGTFVK